MKKFAVVIGLALLATGCVSPKDYEAEPDTRPNCFLVYDETDASGDDNGKLLGSYCKQP